ncbi:T9SS sorting signal type C domain-containing protein [Flavobacterium branchiicola]|nr:T9SS sorting signal type C domain-containing protein [Flavobacterium branchiicola]
MGMFFVVNVGYSQNTWIGGNGTNAGQRSNWHRSGNWSANRIPLATDDVLIPSTASYNPTISSTSPSAAVCANLTIEAGRVLTVSDALTVGGTTSLSGTINVGNTAGTKRFIGLVTVNIGASWNNSANSDINFRGGITNNGTFTSGTGIQTFDSNTQQLTGNFSINNVTVAGSGIVLTNNNTLTCSTALSGNGSLTNLGTLNIGGTSGITTLNATTIGNTVNYTGTGNQTVKITNYYNIGFSGGGTKAVGGNNNTITVNKDFSLTGGKFVLSNNTSNTLTISGNYNQTGGIFDFNAGTSGTSIVNLKGNFSNTAGADSFTTIGVVANGILNFNGTGNQILSVSNVGAGTFVKYNVGATSILKLTSDFTLSTAFTSDTDPWMGELNVSGTVDLGLFKVYPSGGRGTSGTAKFILNSGATFITANAGGVDGSVPVSADMVRTFSNGANYTFNGTVAQNTSAGMPATVNNLTISNTHASGVTLNKATTVTQNFSVTSGSVANLGTGLTHTSSTLTLGGVVMIPGSWGATASGALNKNDTYFAAVTGIINNTCTSPTITGQSQPLTICENGGGNFSVTSSTAGVTYQWQYSSDSINWFNIDSALGSSVSGYTTNNLGLSNTPLGWNGYKVRCVVSNNLCAVNSSSVLLTVNSKPTITLNKTDETCASSNNGTITPVLSGGLSNVRYIKLTQKYVNADAWQQVAEIQAIEIFTGTNVALSTSGASATGSSTYSNNPGVYGAQRAIDGNPASFWHSNSTNINEYIIVDLASAKNLDYLRIYNRSDCCQQRGQNMLLELLDASSNVLYTKTVDLFENVLASHYIDVNVLDVSWNDPATALNRTGLDAGTYTLNFSDAGGCSTSSQATIATTNPNTSITSQPSVSTICAGASTSFSVAALGAALTYKWQVSTNGGSTFSDLSNGGVYSNVTGATLNITGATATMNAYQYQVIVTGTCSAITSSSGALTVNDKPTITAITTPSALCAGGSLNVTTPTVTANGSTVSAQDWQIETAVSSGSYVSLTLPYTVALADDGKTIKYSATNGCGTTNSNSVILKINANPTTPVATPTQPTCAQPTGTITVSSPAPGTGISYSLNGVTFLNTNGVFAGLAEDTYTVYVKNGSGCIASATPITIASTGSITWTGNTSTDWNTPSNWSPAVVPTLTDCVLIPNTGVKNSVIGTNASVHSITVNNGGSLTVLSDKILTVTEGITVGATGSFVFENNSSLIQTSTSNSINTGNITYKRNSALVRRYDFTFWSSPIKASSVFTLKKLSSATLADKYYNFDAATSAWKINYNGTLTMIPGNGYIVRAPQTFDITSPAIYPASFIGTPNNGDIEIIPVATHSYLLGNPYPSALDARKFIEDNALAGNDVGALYFWTHNSPPSSAVAGDAKYNYTVNDYAVYSLTGGVATGPADTGGSQPSGKIAAGQAFFATPSTNVKVKFTNDMRIGANNNQFYKTNTSNTNEENRLWLNFTNTKGAFKQVLVGYVSGATNGWDNNYDGWTMSGNTYLDFYSINEADKLTIQGRAVPFEKTDLIPLGYVTSIAGDFTIAIDHGDGLFTNQAVYLEDKKTGQIVDLRAGNYTFTTAIGTFADRFVLRYTNKTLGTGDFENIENGILVSSKDKTIKVQSSVEAIKEVTIFDVAGKLVYNKKKVTSNELQITNLQAANQVLLINITLENGFTTTRKVIFQ